MTINQSADYVINTLRQPANHELKERVKDSIRNKGAMYLYQRSKQGESTDGLTLNFQMGLVPYNEVDPCLPADDCSWLRTDGIIQDLIPLRIGAPFHNVFGGNGMPYTFITRSQYLHVRFLRTSKGQLFYMWENNHIVIPNNKKLERIGIQTILLDPSAIRSTCDESCYTDDMVLPLPKDILDYILNQVIAEQLNYSKGIIPDKEVEINEK